MKIFIGLAKGLDNNEMDCGGKMNEPRKTTSGQVFLVQFLLNNPESTAVKHLLPPAKLDNNIDGEITSVQFW